eukprot:TRINITY_DN9741_c0_g1_i1.p1 TRINITY_DN9741_c0_g1~~TRINITY_DN9741_c0_g1_i1.p1  ORF type:complete len:267 (+),score=44.33 TRINITY_DN9741_c0_g1_i1:61-801(+)
MGGEILRTPTQREMVQWFKPAKNHTKKPSEKLWERREIDHQPGVGLRVGKKGPIIPLSEVVACSRCLIHKDEALLFIENNQIEYRYGGIGWCLKSKKGEVWSFASQDDGEAQKWVDWFESVSLETAIPAEHFAAQKVQPVTLASEELSEQRAVFTPSPTLSPMSSCSTVGTPRGRGAPEYAIYFTTTSTRRGLPFSGRGRGGSMSMTPPPASFFHTPTGTFSKGHVASMKEALVAFNSPPQPWLTV